MAVLMDPDPGGIGENAAEIRARICDGEHKIGVEGKDPRIWVIPTNEELPDRVGYGGMCEGDSVGWLNRLRKAARATGGGNETRFGTVRALLRRGVEQLGNRHQTS